MTPEQSKLTANVRRQTCGQPNKLGHAGRGGRLGGHHVRRRGYVRESARDVGAEGLKRP